MVIPDQGKTLPKINRKCIYFDAGYCSTSPFHQNKNKQKKTDRPTNILKKRVLNSKTSLDLGNEKKKKETIEKIGKKRRREVLSG